MFANWLLGINEMMENDCSRKIVVLMDKASTHKILECSNVKCIFVCLSTKTLSQAVKTGVIRVIKNRYKRKLFTWVL